MAKIGRLHILETQITSQSFKEKVKTKKCNFCHRYTCICQAINIGRRMPKFIQRIYGCPVVHAGQTY